MHQCFALEETKEFKISRNICETQISCQNFKYAIPPLLRSVWVSIVQPISNANVAERYFTLSILEESNPRRILIPRPSVKLVYVL